jgi:hypothetical protein
MELVDGATIRSWLRERARSCQEVLAAFLDAARGLAAAHEVGLVHRDFKPDNVLVAKNGRVRVTDFGLARSIDDGSERVERSSSAGPGSGPVPAGGDIAKTLTQTGMVKGTPAYMAPEQFLSQPVDARSDQFSYCVALYEALYGERPFQSPTFEGLAKEVIHGRVRSVPGAVDTPPAVRAVLLRGLSVTPDARYPSMDALIAALSPYASSAGAPAPAPRSRTARRLFVAVGLAGLAVAFGAAVVFRPAAAPVVPTAAATPAELAGVPLDPKPAHVAEPAASATPPAPPPTASPGSELEPPRAPHAGPKHAQATRARAPVKAKAEGERAETPVVRASLPAYDDALMEPVFEPKH